MKLLRRPDLELIGIDKGFRGRQVLRQVSLAVQPGEFIAVLGPSGSGKSTLLKIAAGFEQPDSGSVRLQGEDVTTVPPYRRNINTVFQNYALFPHMTVFDNIAYGLRRKKVPAAEVKQRVAEALALVGLASFGPRQPETLSGGEQQRIALARALVNRPAVLLLDEPLSALDLKIRRRMQGELKRIHEEVGTTFLCVTHDQEEAVVLADRITVMRDGGLEQVGTAREIYDRPATPFVADFVGEMNWLRGEAGGGTVRLADGSALHLPEGISPPAGALRVGVRPERLRIAAAGGTPGAWENALAATIARITFQGPSTVVEARTAAGEAIRCLCGPADAAGSLLPGSAILCLWDAGATLVFETAGARAGPGGVEQAGG
ncbi:ABC transporter ATP-binding protein [Siccirubricoccus sp. KC 17139]|uniref:ABC transporter ATP-binding protein n=1 Tax=Siccirubricoccus soli TaxID=2899147 RepID=A0ABT1D5G8_9PROT|nr:ABC transporter ATP-binding protein [Siccirubricoccus soli]MCO6417172.1 ABC transporter ATP-binding protein [Siccirubricoccus soli]MCP2683307.1 ABC transporter ATP-binding protein [Siccirubricoccus soli]